ncbi:MAG: aminotransferase class IV [Planctomycetia bacterium]|nr:aminotransferase class IV [Planctomycetia bacterium]
MNRDVYVNGEFVPEGEARISAADAGFLLGVGVFETLRAYNGRVFRLEDHLGRLRLGTEAFNIELTETDDEIRGAIARLIAGNGVPEARLRLTVSQGPLGRDPLPEGGQGRATVVITATDVAPYPDEFYENGMSVLVSKTRVSESDPTTRHKTTNYLPRLVALKEAHEAGCGEALMFNSKNHLAEGAVSNAFIVSNGELVTPQVSEGLLPGITRKVVLGLAGELQIPAREGPVVMDDILSADEMFLTNSIMEIMPVCMIEHHAIGGGKPGPVTRRLRDAYRSAVEKDAHPE